MWMRVDDKLHAHKKRHRAGIEAMGLWVVVGSWVADSETDGWVPDYVVASFAPNAADLAGRLVAAGLWVEDEQDGDQGYRFHDWSGPEGGTGWNPSAEDLTRKRDEARERMRRVRAERRSGVRANTAGTSPEVRSAPLPHPHPHPEPPPEVPEGSGEDEPADAGQPAAEEPAPASRKRSAPSTRGTRLAADWWPDEGDLTWFREKCPTLASQSGAGSTATEAFRDHFRSQSSAARAVRTDWSATWRNWMRREEKDAARGARRGPGGRATDDERVRAFAAATALPDHGHGQPYDIPLPGTDQGATVHQLPRSEAR